MSGESPPRFDRQIKEAGASGTGNALLDLVRLNGFDAAEPAIQFGVLHDLEHVRVQDRMNDEQIQMIEVVVAEHLAGCAQHISKGMARDGSDQIRGGFLIFTCANHLKNPISANGLGPTLHVPERRRLPSRGSPPAILWRV